jgi:hypothetical protein
VLQAFAEYLAGSGERDADFQARVRLGSVVLAEQAFRGLSRRPVSRRLEPEALRDLARKEGGEGAVLPLEIGKQGRGRLYYTASLRYALEAESQEARDEGIGLATMLADRAGKEADSLRLGEVYRVKVVIYSSRDRDFLALRVPIPAGVEGPTAPVHLPAVAGRGGGGGPEASRLRRVSPLPVRRCTTRKCAFDRFPRAAVLSSWCGPPRRALHARRQRPS